MSHKHFCDITGHCWECRGKALRPLVGDTEPSICMCHACQVPMEQGDHSKCRIELLACPEHMGEQLRQEAEARQEHERRAAEFGLDEKFKRMQSLPDDDPNKDVLAREIVEWLFSGERD